MSNTVNEGNRVETSGERHGLLVNVTRRCFASRRSTARNTPRRNHCNGTLPTDERGQANVLRSRFRQRESVSGFVNATGQLPGGGANGMRIKCIQIVEPIPRGEIPESRIGQIVEWSIEFSERPRNGDGCNSPISEARRQPVTLGQPRSCRGGPLS